MKWHKSARNILLAMAFASLWGSGCGSKSAANQVLVSVFGPFSVMVPTQSQTIVANVTGATDVSATFDCSYTTTPNPTTATPSPKPSASAECTSANGAVGVLSNIQNTSTTAASTATFTAPQVFPDQTKLPNVIVTITATANADKKKTGKFSLAFDSGIRITLTPATATLGTVETQLFLAKGFSGTIIPPDQLTWGVTFESTARTNSALCNGGSNDCGSVDKTTGKYTAPAAVPVAAPSSTTVPVNAAGIVTLFAFSNVDNARIAQAAVTVVKAGDITFSGISPSFIPQGALQQDIFLAATNATSQIGVKLTAPCGDIPVDQQSQIKVVFAPGTTSSSIGARIRLSSTQLTGAGDYQLQVTSSNPSVKVTGGPFPLHIIPVRPTIVSSTPENLQESTLGQNGITIDGGYFGTSVGTLPTCTVSPTITPQFNNTSSATPPSSVTARRLAGFLPTPSASNPNAGLFPLSVKYSTSPGPFAAPISTTAYTNIAVIPDYANSNSPSPLPAVTFPASSWPSAIALDSVKGYAVVTLAGQNAFQPTTPPTPPATVNTAKNVQFINLAGGTPTLAGTVSSQGFLATGVAVDDQLHVAAVVNYASRSLTVHSIPSGMLLGTVDLSGVIPPPATSGSSFVAPFPYSVGIDSFSHHAVVAFASTNVGLVINLDTSSTADPNNVCILPGQTATPNFCPIAYVTLNSGANPQIAFEAGAHLAYVTPGGAGLLSAVDLANPSVGSVGVASATRASNAVTVTTSAAHNLNPGNPGTVLISGLPVGSAKMTNFDGSFSVDAVLDATHFRYSQADKDDTSACPAPTPPSTAPVCTANSGVPFLTYIVSPSTLGIAINPITRRAILVDPNAPSSQINFIDPISQNVNFMTVFVGATGTSTGSPELGAATVAFQPFTNTALSFNSTLNELSLLDPTLLQRIKILPTLQTAKATVIFTPDQATNPITVNLPGALAVDSANNLALAVNSGSSNISVFKLGSVKSVHIERVLTTPIDSSSTGISVPAQLAQAVKITSGVAPQPIGPVRILGAGFTVGSKVELDGIDIAPLGATVTRISSQELDVTFPAGFFTSPQHLALQAVDSAGVLSNVMDFTVVEEVLLPACSGTAAAPGGVAIDEVHNLALVTNTGCHQVSVISLDPANSFGAITNTIQTGGTPTGVAVLPRLAITGQPAGTSGVAVVTNSSANTVSILDLANMTQVAGVTDVAVGTSPSGVAINQETNLAVIANTGSNTVSTLDLTPLTASPIGKLTPATVAVDQSPIAVAIDPDRGTNGRGLAVVTCLQLNGAAAPVGVLDGVDIGGTTPLKLGTAAACGSLPSCGTPTGVVFDPAVSPALFYSTSTQGNQITAFNPDTNQTVGIKVGINPTAIAYNFQTGTMLTVNALSNSISIVDSQTFRTKATLGIGGTSRFSAAIHTFTNLAVIADQANNRVLLFPLPK
jgi:DNA-binding beta-propeller fold protein YncE